jgi:uroporphyrinogen-III synthase
LLAGSEKQYLLQSPVIVPSDRVARLAADLGWDRVIRAQDASDQGFLNAIKPMLSVDGNG